MEGGRGLQQGKGGPAYANPQFALSFKTFQKAPSAFVVEQHGPSCHLIALHASSRPQSVRRLAFLCALCRVALHDEVAAHADVINVLPFLGFLRRSLRNQRGVCVSAGVLQAEGGGWIS